MGEEKLLADNKGIGFLLKSPQPIVSRIIDLMGLTEELPLLE